MGKTDFIVLENALRPKFLSVLSARNEIYAQLESLADGKRLKGDEIVGWLGEIYGKLLLGGTLIDEGFEPDLLTEDGRRVSIKARKGKSWRQSSAIPKIEGDGSPTHLLFLRLSDDYLVHTIWLHDWEKLRQEGRFKVHRVRDQHRSYIFNVNEGLDRLAIFYERNPVIFRG
jgi:hypothetical protein